MKVFCLKRISNSAIIYIVNTCRLSKYDLIDLGDKWLQLMRREVRDILFCERMFRGFCRKFFVKKEEDEDTNNDIDMDTDDQFKDTVAENDLDSDADKHALGKFIFNAKQHHLFDNTHAEWLFFSILADNLPNNLNLFIKTLSGKTVSMEISVSYTVAMLKKMIEEKIDVPFKEQRLVYGTKQLDDDHFIYEYGIQNYSTCHLSIRLLGGNEDIDDMKPQSKKTRIHEWSDDSLSEDLSIMSTDSSEQNESILLSGESKLTAKKSTLKPPSKKSRMTERFKESNSTDTLSDDSSIMSTDIDEPVSEHIYFNLLLSFHL